MLSWARSCLRRRRFAVLAVLPLLLVVSAPVLAAPRVAGAVTSGQSDWPSYLFSGGHSSYNAAATSITPSNVGQLAPAWQWIVPPSPNSATTDLLASPTVVNGVVYIGAKDGVFYAIDEATQSVIWSRFLAIDTPKGSCGVGDTQGIISTATVTTDPTTGLLTVYVYAPDGYLYALDAATGNIVWRALVYTPSSTVNDYYSWGSPLVANGNVYIGISSDCDNPLVPGGLASFNQSSGAAVAKWSSQSPGQLGGSVWSSPAVLADGSIIVTTGNGYASSGQPLYDESIVRLDGSSLKLLDAWQVPAAQQVNDADFGASPTLFSADLNGVVTPMVGACNKNGLYYAFEQSDLAAGPVWETRITVPYPGGAKECIAAAIWDGTNLIEAGGAPTTINGTSYVGSIQSLNPATGAVIWQTGLDGTILGSPSEDGAGVIAAPTYQSSNGELGVYLIAASSGAVIGFIPTPASALFGQAVFAGNDLLIGAGPKFGLTAYEVATAGPALTSLSPSTLAPGTATTVTVTGSGFSGTPTASVSGTGVIAGKVTVVSSTKATFKLTVYSSAAPGSRNVALSVPGQPPTQ
ncbi:MAG: outer membrane protein assembly factor BamB family protein, partial [Acidimicrobiales bacterium]